MPVPRRWHSEPRAKALVPRTVIHSASRSRLGTPRLGTGTPHSRPDPGWFVVSMVLSGSCSGPGSAPERSTTHSPVGPQSRPSDRSGFGTGGDSRCRAEERPAQPGASAARLARLPELVLHCPRLDREPTRSLPVRAPGLWQVLVPARGVLGAARRAATGRPGECGDRCSGGVGRRHEWGEAGLVAVRGRAGS